MKKEIRERQKVVTEKNVWHCQHCGKRYDTETEKQRKKWIVFQPKTRASVAMCCPDCLKVRKKVDDRRPSDYEDGKGTSFLYRITVEGRYTNKSDIAMLVGKEYGLKPLQYKGGNVVRLYTMWYTNLHGVKYIMKACTEFLQVSSFTLEISEKYTDCKSNQDYMDMFRECIQNTKLYGISKMKVEKDLIIATFTETKNPFHTVNLFKECIEAIGKEKSVKWAGKLVLKYTEGKANCQRPERNNSKK